MSVEEEQSREASDGESEEDHHEDPSDENLEESSDPDGHSDLDSDTETEEDCGRPDTEPRLAPQKRLANNGHKAREAARNELPYTFAGRQTLGLLMRWDNLCDLAISLPLWGHLSRVETEGVLPGTWTCAHLRRQGLSLAWSGIWPEC